jgi:hypothetical protein
MSEENLMAEINYKYSPMYEESELGTKVQEVSFAKIINVSSRRAYPCSG